MEPTFWGPFLAGIALGIFGVILVFALRPRKKIAPVKPQNVVMQGVNEILEVLGPSALIVNSTNYVVRATTAAIALGLVDGRTLVHKRLCQSRHRFLPAAKTRSYSSRPEPNRWAMEMCC